MGIIVMLSRIIDGVPDPIVGNWSDRITTRWGRRTPFIVIGLPIWVLGVWFLWVPPIEFTDVTFLGYEFNNGYPWLLFALILFYAGSTIKDVPYSAWGAELSTQYNERTLIMSWREGFSVAGSLIGALTPAIIVFFGYTKPTDAVYFLSIYIVIVSPIFIINNLWSVPEYPVKETRKEKLPILEGLQYVWDNEPYRKLVIIFLFSTIGAAMTNTLSFFFVKPVSYTHLTLPTIYYV